MSDVEFNREALTWQVGFSKTLNGEPEEWVEAQVPGSVQLDWARAHGWPDHNVADNWRDYLWMEDVWWVYRPRLELVAPVPKDQHLVLVCGGIDYRFRVFQDGHCLHDQEGMFTPFEVDLTDAMEHGSAVEIRVWPAPKSRPAPADRVQANQCCKPAVAYSWDFHPRLIPLGIWDETYVEYRPAQYLRRAEVFYSLADDFWAAATWVEVGVGGTTRSGTLRWRLTDPRGTPVVERSVPVSSASQTLNDIVPSPQLWWPNGQGAPALYTSTVELLDDAGVVVQTRTSRVGFRRVRLVMHPGAWEYPDNRRFPKSRSHPPITLEVNGRAIFCKGSNWVTPDIFPGLMTPARYAELLQLATAAHMNLLRCWGGANVQKEAFFEWCDAQGLMVWQEFPLACNRYEGTSDYLRVLDQESRSIIQRLRQHPCVVLWCGGNELFNAWSGMTDQDLALRLLNRNCYDLDPQRPFLLTSPLDGMGHGHYIFRSPEGQEVFQLFAEAACTAYTEFGCGGPASVETLRAIIPEKDLFPVKPGTAWETHHAVLAWEPNSHLLLDVIERYFGPCATVEQIVERGQFLQGEGLKCLFEEARRQWPKASMALNWCFDEPWPCAANMSIVEWPAKPKRAYHQVARALRPVLASAKIARFQWREGDLFAPELWLLNDSPEALAPGRVEVFLRAGSDETFLLGWDFPGVGANQNLPGPVVRFCLPRYAVDRLTLVLRVAQHPERDSEYVVVYAAADALPPAATRPLNQ